MRPALLLAPSLLLGNALASCGNPCETLGPICTQCQDQEYQNSCKAIVAANHHEVCSEDVAVFNALCPPPLGFGGAPAAPGSGPSAGSTTAASGSTASSANGSGGAK